MTADSDYITSLLEAALALALVAVLALVGLRLGAQRGLYAKRGKSLAIEEMLRIDAKNALVIVRVEERRFLLGTHGTGSPRLLTELTRAREPAGARVDRTQLAEPGE